MKYIVPMFLLTTLIGCSAPVNKVEMKNSISSKMGITPKEIKYISNCSFTITAKTSHRGSWQPCTLAETDKSISILSRNTIAFSTDYSKIRAVGLPKNYTRHEVQLFMPNSIVALQLSKKFDLIDEAGVLNLFNRIKSKGIKVNHSAKHISDGQVYIPIILP